MHWAKIMWRIYVVLAVVAGTVNLLPPGQAHALASDGIYATAIAAGNNHNLVLRSDGTVLAWGDNSKGQLGDGTTISRTSPVQVSGLDGVAVTAIAAGTSHSLALDSEGRVWAWGDNTYGQMGDGSTTIRTTPAVVPNLGDVTAISSGYNHGLALKSDGTLWAWGYNNRGQIGDNSTTNRLTPVQVTGLSGVTIASISAGGTFNLMLDSAGNVWGWGYNGVKQLASNTLTTAPVPIQLGVSGAKAIAAGANHSLAVMNDGTVKTWGYNGSGQLGDGGYTNQYVPVSVGIADVAAVSGWTSHSLALKSDGTVWAWGSNLYGQLGDGTVSSSYTPVQVSGLGEVTAIAAGETHSLALRKDGTVAVWGDESKGQLGLGTPLMQLAPVQASIEDAVSVAGGGWHSLAISSDGSLWAWGDNSYGIVNDGTTTSNPIPHRTSITDAIEASSSGYHVLAVRSDGTLWSWGANVSGQLGDGTTTNRESPAQVAGLSGIREAEAGSNYSVALKDDGTVWAWGINGYNQLGDGTQTTRLSPVQVSGLTDVEAISSGYAHSVALKSDGTVWAWGFNQYGQLGNGTAGGNGSVPVQVPGLADVEAISAGEYFNLALRNDGTVWAWGWNNSGQIGVGSADATVNSPTQVTALAGIRIVAIAGGTAHSLAVAEDGSVWAWGSNSKGQLGDGTTTNRSTPVQVEGLSGVTEAAAGSIHSLALRSDGTVWTWGSTLYGQLGEGSISFRATPVLLSDFPSNDADLTDLQIDGTSVDGFSSDDAGPYAVNVPNATTSVSVTYETSNEEATVALTGGSDLAVGDNAVTATVTAPNGSTKSYEIIVHRISISAELTDLQIDGTTVAGFASGNVGPYAANVPSTTTAVGVTYTLSDSAASAIVTGGTDLMLGANDVTVEVTAEDGTMKMTYEITVYRQSGDGSLTDLQVNGTTVEGFDSDDVGPYEVTIAGATSVNVTYTKLDASASVVVVGDTGLTVGANTVTVTVTAEDGTVKVYEITVHVQSGDATLADLRVNGTTLSGFASGNTGPYGVTVPNATTAVAIAYTAADSEASVEVTGGDDLQVGANTVTVTVTAADGITTKVYTIMVTREDEAETPTPSAELADLQVNGATLSGFSSGNTGPYTITVPNATTAVAIAYTAADSEASVEVAGGDDLRVGANTVTITVTAADGIMTKVYTIIVTREDEAETPTPSAELADLQVNGTTVSGFASGNTGPYGVTVPNATTAVAIAYTAADSEASVEVTGGDDLQVGANTVTITVTATDGITTKVYTIIVTRENATTPSGPSSPSGPSVPSTGTDEPEEQTAVLLNGESAQAEVTEITNDKGQKVMRVVVDGAQLSKVLSSASDDGVVLDVHNEAPVVEVVLPMSALLSDAVDAQRAVVRIKAAGASYSLPIRVLAGLPKDALLTLTISKLSEADLKLFGQSATRQGAQVLSEPIAFSLSVNGQELTDFNGTYVDRTILLDGAVDADRATAVWMDANGQLHFIPATFERDGNEVTATIHSPHNSIYAIIQSSKIFADTNGHWARKDIESLASKLIVNGISNESFAPNATITRAEFAALLVRALGLQAEATDNPFDDVQANDWFAADVQAALQAGLIRGFADGTFRPNERITREQMAVMIAGAIKASGNRPETIRSEAWNDLFADAEEISAWAKEGVEAAARAGIIGGREDGTFAPASQATRAEAVAMLRRMLQAIGFIN
ncbi:RCC1 domain-containing protein [Cohnella fermenti]|uniref:SLH domain-containing protein n=1 Tax=Cohnella fermenti TaxID=2565925 RepID=A0A4S4C223_9BACL|nr:cadherin-like beta sandwich domain-containing protein [Cohnella fermenti]THF81724.1 hypothetical protein E6C55_08335 [Cohnella fermenti]